jgi:hypothetical protein
MLPAGRWQWGKRNDKFDVKRFQTFRAKGYFV